MNVDEWDTNISQNLEQTFNFKYIISSLFFVMDIINLFPYASYTDMVEYTLTLMLLYLNL